MLLHRDRSRSRTLLTLLLCLLASGPLRFGFAQDRPIRFIRVEQEIIESRLRQYAQNNADRESNLKRLFMDAGCINDHLVEQPVKHQTPPNVICTLPGTGDSVITIGAHFDHVKRGDGVVDDWSGAGLLPSLYQSLKGEPRTHTFVFIGFSGEEQGLVGSDFYVKQLAPEQIAKIRVMIDLDCLGLGPTNIWLRHSDEKLANVLNTIASSMDLRLAVVNADQVGDEDSTSFRKRGVPTIMLHSITQGTLPLIHSDRDTLDAIRSDDYYDTYRLLASYLSYLDVKLD